MHAEDGAVAFTWHRPQLLPTPPQQQTADASRASQQPAAAAATATGNPASAAGCKLPLATRRDHAACTTGSNQFVICGGFDGCRELLDVHVVTVDCSTSGTAGGTGGAAFHIGSLPLADAGASTAATASMSPQDAVQYSVLCMELVPRNRQPFGRSHHTAVHDPEARSLYVFGGYSSSHGADGTLAAPYATNAATGGGQQGTMAGTGFGGNARRGGVLGELWVLSFDHNEWWQPQAVGDAPPARRSHVAAFVGGRMFVHGGFDGERCLGDTWVWEPRALAWQRLETKGMVPSPRRGHACEALDDR